MTKEQAEQIRRIVDNAGWPAVRDHPVLGPVWAAALREQREYTDRVCRNY